MTDNPSTGNTAHTVDPTAAVDVQDPLPESNFFWRRVFAYVGSAALLALLGYVIFKMEEPESLRLAALYLAVLLWFSITYYMIAPSAEQIVRIIQAAKVLKAGVPISRSARAETDQGSVEVTTQAGSPAPYPPPSDDEDAAPRARRSI